ncbi:M23 family metallopeptidase [Candidatus Haliotispira prima]|uniref:M23 family metallopeptidase n=1 Tax=Candidatus Haliotispira prima TaxID=3034016 RepID=A0ABY8MFE5_9SPIO|nr:M23 family metallopeptidase [Candidatus Haliotispira prima]
MRISSERYQNHDGQNRYRQTDGQTPKPGRRKLNLAAFSSRKLSAPDSDYRKINARKTSNRNGKASRPAAAEQPFHEYPQTIGRMGQGNRPGDLEDIAFLQTNFPTNLPANSLADFSVDFSGHSKRATYTQGASQAASRPSSEKVLSVSHGRDIDDNRGRDAYSVANPKNTPLRINVLLARLFSGKNTIQHSIAGGPKQPDYPGYPLSDSPESAPQAFSPGTDSDFQGQAPPKPFPGTLHSGNSGYTHDDRTEWGSKERANSELPAFLRMKSTNETKAHGPFRASPIGQDHRGEETTGHQVHDGARVSYSGATADETYNKEMNEGFWEILANFSLWLIHSLRLEGLLFLFQIIVLSLLVQQYIPPLSRYYFDQSANVLLLPSEDTLDQLLNEDILLTNAAGSPNNRRRKQPTNMGVGGGESRRTIALASVPGLTSETIKQRATKPETIQAILHPSYSSYEYTVQSGESISLLAQRFRLNMSTLINVNHIERAKSLRAGQKIQIPNIDGLFYRVQNKDNLAGISRKYDSSIGALIDTNQLQDEKLIAGSQIFIPGATLSSYELRKVFGNLYIYPYAGRLSSRFGYRRDPFRRNRREFHNGLDIVGSQGAPVRASSDGTVASVGYHTIYGNYVILQHAKGIKTLYGHMSKVLVSKHQKVTQGSAIGRIGSSGRSTGAHVHFTIFVAGKAVNPLDYLSEP